MAAVYDFFEWLQLTGKQFFFFRRFSRTMAVLLNTGFAANTGNPFKAISSDMKVD